MRQGAAAILTSIAAPRLPSGPGGREVGSIGPMLAGLTAPGNERLLASDRLAQ